MISEKIAQAKELIANGEICEAKKLLLHILTLDPASEQVYVLLVLIEENTDKQIVYLRKVVEFNPKNSKAKGLLDRLQDEKKSKRLDATESDKQHQKHITEHDGNNSSERAETLPRPMVVRRPAEDDFFYGFREGVNPSSRMLTGMFGWTMIIDGIHFPLFDGPPCIRVNNPRQDCDVCDFFPPHDCLLRFDHYLLEDISRFTQVQSKRHEIFVRRRRIIIKTIHKELKAHGRPLHFSVIARIIIGRHPNLQLKAGNVYRYLSWHPELFERVDAGVYRAI